jgi:hypothetical protein
VIRCLSAVNGKVICFRVSLSQQIEENAAVCCLLASVCSLTTPELIQPSYRKTDTGFKIGGVTTSAIFSRSGTQRFSPLLAPERRSTSTSLPIGWGGRGGGAWVAGTATERLLLPTNLCRGFTRHRPRRTHPILPSPSPPYSCGRLGCIGQSHSRCSKLRCVLQLNSVSRRSSCKLPLDGSALGPESLPGHRSPVWWLLSWVSPRDAGEVPWFVCDGYICARTAFRL